MRRVNGKTLTDDEMIEYYSNLLKSIGGKSNAHYLTGLALVTENGKFVSEISEDPFILISTRDEKHDHRGNPLDVLTIDPKSQKYYTEMTDDDFKNMGQNFDKMCVEFIKENLLKAVK